MGRSAYLSPQVNNPVARRDALLEFILLAAEEESARPFPEHVVDALRRIVQCDTVAYRAWDRRQGVFDISCSGDDIAARQPVWARYALFRHSDPHPSEPAGPNGDTPPLSAAEYMARPLVLSERISDRRFWQTGLYFELMKPFGVRDVMKLFLPRARGVASVLVFDTSGRGFGEMDRTLLERLLPALDGFQRNARLRSAALHADDRLELLTPRERSVLGRAAAGETNAEIAAALFVGVSTVRKHLEHIYDKLETRNRTTAAALYTQAVRSRDEPPG
jgi:DNA-binding CsgD family transcriptional regulator